MTKNDPKPTFSPIALDTVILLLPGKSKMEKLEGIPFNPVSIKTDNGPSISAIILLPEALFLKIMFSIFKRLKALLCACSMITVSEPTPPSMRSSTDILLPVNLNLSFPCSPKIEF